MHAELLLTIDSLTLQPTDGVVFYNIEIRYNVYLHRKCARKLGARALHRRNIKHRFK